GAERPVRASPDEGDAPGRAEARHPRRVRRAVGSHRVVEVRGGDGDAERLRPEAQQVEEGDGVRATGDRREHGLPPRHAERAEGLEETVCERTRLRHPPKLWGRARSLNRGRATARRRRRALPRAGAPAAGAPADASPMRDAERRRGKGVDYGGGRVILQDVRTFAFALLAAATCLVPRAGAQRAAAAVPGLQGSIYLGTRGVDPRGGTAGTPGGSFDLTGRVAPGTT